MNGEQDELWVVTVGRRKGSGSCPVAVFGFSGIETSGSPTK
jgi:hypothetical protein